MNGDEHEKGFSKVMDQAMAQPYLVIDLRGVVGGSDDVSIDLMVARLLGHKIDTVLGLKQEVEGRSSESLQLELNQLDKQAVDYRAKGEPLPERLGGLIKKYRELLPVSEREGAAKFEIFPAPKPVILPHEQLGFKKPIYVLVDALCGSACESTLEALLLHPTVVTVGENTRGEKHFTMQGRVLLPKSKLLVRIPFKYNEYDYYIEKTGHAPMRPVPAGSDALDWLVKSLPKF
jgi:hypothetical protein